MARRFQSNRKEAGSLLASVFITGLGFGACMFVVAALSPASVYAAAWSLGAVLVVFVTLVVMFRFGKTPSNSVGFLLSASKNRRDDGLADYEPRIANQPRSATSPGTNQPITAEEVHEIQLTSANTWVPAGSRRKRKKSQE